MFSVIIPLYNKAPFIRRAIDSVLRQEFEDYEIIVVNDGSTDGGGSLVEKTYGERVKLFNQTNSGVSVARNLGIQQAQFPWIAFLDADDYWHPQYLKLMAQAISENPGIGIFGAHYDSVRLSENPQLKYFLFQDYFKQAVRNTYFFTSATVVKKLFFEKNEGFDPRIKLGEDIDVWLRTSLFFGDGIYINNTMVYYGQEDKARATSKLYKLEETLILKLFDKDYYKASIDKSTCSLKEFIAFRDRWVLFNLYPLIKDQNTKALVNTISNKYILVKGFYYFPILFSILSFKSIFRKYMKFCFRYIYK